MSIDKKISKILEETYSRFEDKVDIFEILSESDKSYKEFFRKKMKEYGIKNINDFKSEEEKKKFFNDIDKEWKAENESD